jgi:hypothetical protein
VAVAQTHFLNGEVDPGADTVSVSVNGGPRHVLPGLDAQSGDPYVALGLGANPAPDVLGTGAGNSVTIVTESTARQVTWTVTLDGITPDQDIQFLIFENSLFGRQGERTEGFGIAEAT